ncbi:MAG: alkaline phosphatase family protein [Solirubrobacteraceae bacterium]
MRIRAKAASVAVGVAVAAAAVAVPVGLSAQSAAADHTYHQRIEHVLLISVDGMHQSDLDWYVANHPNSALAELAEGGQVYTNNHTSDPSDSDPGGTALMTGADPKVTGIYYDDEYSHDVFPPGTTNCSGPVPGGNVIYDSPDEIDPSSLDAGQGIPGLAQNPALIMNMTGDPTTLLVPSTFPVDPKTCEPIYPHSYIKVNTIFNVIKAAGLRTAWSDKHPVYESFNGPSGNGIDDLFTPEIDSNAIEPNGQPYCKGCSWTDDNAATKQYDSYKVQAVINWISGYDHSGAGPKVGTPAIYGMNFQAVSTAEKLKSSPAELIGPDAQGNYTEGTSLPGGYTTDNGVQVPGPLLQSALDFVNASLRRMVDTIQADGEADSTAIILTAKHGQSPLNDSQLQRIDDGPIIAAVNAAWAAQHPSNPTLVVQEADDDGLLWWLSDRSQQAAEFVKAYLWTHTAPAVNYAGQTITVQHSGLQKIFAGRQSARFFGVPYSDPDHPDVFAIAQVGTIYTTGSKIAEHGGDNPGDRDVPLVVYAPGNVQPGQLDQWVETTQVAPTILKLLGLDPNQLQAVQQEGTQALPGIAEQNH